MNRSTLLRIASLFVLASAAVLASASCESPTVGDSCNPTCQTPSVCEAVCPCGNGSCQTYECVTPDDAGLFVFADGGSAVGCSQP